MDVSQINWMAVIAAAFFNFLLGGLWYSQALFGTAWQTENRLSDEDLRKGSQARIFGFAFVWSLVMSVNLAMFLDDASTDAVWGLSAGFLAGFGWVAASIFLIGIFERRSTRYMLINSGYMVVSFLAMGLILGAWR